MAVVMTSTEGRERLSGEGESEWERRRGGSTAPVITVSAALQLKITVKYHSSLCRRSRMYDICRRMSRVARTTGKVTVIFVACLRLVVHHCPRRRRVRHRRARSLPLFAGLTDGRMKHNLGCTRSSNNSFSRRSTKRASVEREERESKKDHD